MVVDYFFHYVGGVSSKVALSLKSILDNFDYFEVQRNVAVVAACLDGFSDICSIIFYILQCNIISIDLYIAQYCVRLNIFSSSQQNVFAS